MSKSRPIICNSESVRAILEGRKVQSRRVIKASHKIEDCYFSILDGFLHYVSQVPSGSGTEFVLKCPYGIPGDKLWVRETFWIEHDSDGDDFNIWDCGINLKEDDWANIRYPATDEKPTWEFMSKRPSIHMPKWASRITLEIKDVRVERVQDITSSDACREGILSLGRAKMLQNFPEYAQKYSEWRLEDESLHFRRPLEARIKPPLAPSPRARFGKWWDFINAKKGFGWETDPWVFVLEFERSDNG